MEIILNYLKTSNLSINVTLMVEMWLVLKSLVKTLFHFSTRREHATIFQVICWQIIFVAYHFLIVRYDKNANIGIFRILVDLN